MSNTPHIPSKLERFMTIFGGAFGFTVLFLVGVSAFVDYLGTPRNGSGIHIQMASHDSQGKSTDGKNKTGSKPADSSPDPAPAISPALMQLLASGDKKRGARVAGKCAGCHSFDKGGKNIIGPNLYGVLGRKIATMKGFKYSRAMKGYAQKASNWRTDNLIAFLKKPKKLVRKTKMVYSGLKKDKDMANLIAYLRENSDNPAVAPSH